MPNQDQLSIVVTTFEYWRSNHYSSNQITSALSISGSQLKQWRKCVVPTTTKPQFVHLPISTSPTSLL